MFSIAVGYFRKKKSNMKIYKVIRKTVIDERSFHIVKFFKAKQMRG